MFENGIQNDLVALLYSYYTETLRVAQVVDKNFVFVRVECSATFRSDVLLI